MSVTPAKTNTLLAKYLAQLVAHPLRTKAATSATFCFLQEVLGSNLAGLPVKKPSRDAPFLVHVLARSHIDLKAIKMALYGMLLSAPMSHYLVGALQRAFAGKTGLGARIAQILASNLLIAPIQTAVYLSSMAVINGAKSYKEVIGTVRAGFFSVIRVRLFTLLLVRFFDGISRSLG
jgi:peroxisomal membrane protein 2